MLGKRPELLRFAMLILLALTIVVSLQTVGVGLVAALLVTPAATAYLLTRRLPAMMAVSAAVGAASSVAGLYVSYYLDVASGAAVVLIATGAFLVAFVAAPRPRRAGASGGGAARGVSRPVLPPPPASIVAAETTTARRTAMATTLVLGYDGSDCAQTALARTVDARRRDARRHGGGRLRLRVLHRLRADGHDRLAAHDERRVRRPRRSSCGATARARWTRPSRSSPRPASKAEKVVAEGRPVEVLLETAKEHDAALIVVGSHGEGAVSAAFLGSTALKLLHHSELPVLVVPRHDKH